MSHIPHDEFAKSLLVSLLEPLGQVTRQLEIPGETLHIDVAFNGLDPSLTTEDVLSLGLLGRVVAHPCLLEPYRSPLSSHHVTSGMSKLLWRTLEYRRNLKRAPISTPPPWMWILSPRASASLLEDLLIVPIRPHSAPRSSFPPTGPGLYWMGPRWRLGVIVIQELDPTPDTLLLRLLGRGQTQLQAAQEIAALDPQDPKRNGILDLMVRWSIFSNNLSASRRKEKEVLMFLRTAASQAYDQQLEQRRLDGLSQGRTAGICASVLRTWRRKFGEVPPPLATRLESIKSVSSLEEMLDHVLDGQDRDETLNQLLNLAAK